MASSRASPSPIGSGIFFCFFRGTTCVGLRSLGSLSILENHKMAGVWQFQTKSFDQNDLTDFYRFLFFLTEGLTLDWGPHVYGVGQVPLVDSEFKLVTPFIDVLLELRISEKGQQHDSLHQLILTVWKVNWVHLETRELPFLDKYLNSML